jgi:2'-5' RNA ligase
MAETAVVVTVAAADSVVVRPPEGIPAHVTLLYPFAESERMAGMVSELRAELGRFPSFALTLTRLDRFEGPPSVLYAVPEPKEPFLAMTEALSARFGFLPYGGVHDDVVPHLTIAVADDPGTFADMEAAVARSLPITTVVDTVEVWEHESAGWRLLHRVALGE